MSLVPSCPSWVCLGLLSALLSCSGDDDKPRDECLAAGCITGQTITLEASDKVWVAGSYDVEVIVNGGTSTCSFVVDAGRSDVTASCTDKLTASFGFTRSCDADNPSDCVKLDGYTLTMLVPGTLPEVIVKMHRDGALVNDFSFPVRFATRDEFKDLGCYVCHIQALNVILPD